MLLRLQAGGVLLLSLLVTAGMWWQVREQGRNLAQARFNIMANQVVTALSDRMANYEQTLRGGVGLFDAFGSADRHQWRVYVERLRIDLNYPGIQGIGFAERVRAGELEAHVAKLRREGFPDYVVHPGGARDDYFPIVYLEPFADRNLRALGFDMFAKPIRREAMQRAMDEGEAALSGGVTLVQETHVDTQVGTLLYVPVYAGGAAPDTVEGRRQAVLGFVYSPFRMDDLVHAVLGDRGEEVRLEIRDGDTLLYGLPDDQPADHEIHQVVDVYGRPWQVRVRSTPALEAVIVVKRSPVVLIAGILISVLLTWLTLSMLTERRERVALAAANQALAKARGAAEAANRAKSRFLAAASHDIRQPVQSIMLLTGALTRHIAEGPAKTLLGHLDSATESLRVLLNSLLDISRLDAGVVVPEVTTIAVGPLLRQLAEEYRLRAEAKGLGFESIIAAAAVRTDPALFERILRNLLENALRYTREGHIVLRCRAQDDVVFVEIEDTGIGIPDHQLQSVFEEFYQAENRVNRNEDAVQGLGLGLSIVQRLALMLDHRIEVRSQPGRGSCFTITLVRVRAAKDSLVA